MIATPRLAALLLFAAPSSAAAEAPPVSTIQEIAAAVPEGTDAAAEQRLEALAAQARRIAVRPQSSYDPVARAFQVRLPEEVQAVEQPGAAGAQKRVVSYRLAPVNRERVAVLQVPCPPSEAPAMVDDLRLLIDFKVVRPPPGPKGERRPALARTSAPHAASKKEPWQGTLEVVTLAVEVERTTLVRSSSGEVLAQRAAGEAPPPSAAVETKGKGPAAPRKSIDRYGRAGSQWTMKEQMNFMNLCYTRFPEARDKLDVQRRCRCVMEYMQLRHPKTPPQRIDSKEDEELIGRCSPTPPSR